MTARTIGIVANPASGKDVRRLVASASVFDNREKCAIIRRALSGAINAGGTHFAYLDDSHNIAGSALEEVAGSCDVDVTMVPCLHTSSALDTIRGAECLRQYDPIATLILGGDGTSRAFVKGWRHALLLPLSTGTNNVFPQFAEATVAGAALGVLAAGGVSPEEVAMQVKIIDIEVEGEDPDIALIDAVVTRDRFIGSRALLGGKAIERVFLTLAEPMAVGMTAIGGLVMPLGAKEDAGLCLTLGASGSLKVRAPVAPGMYETLGVEKVDLVPFGEGIELAGPCVLAFDGEREREIQAGQAVRMRISRTGPSLLDIEKTMQLAASRKLFVQ